MSDKNYYLLEIDDMVIALENKDTIIKELKELLKECKEFIKTEQKILVKCDAFYENLINAFLIKIDNAIGEKK